MSPATAPTLLSIPCELRNAIYHYVFSPNPAAKLVDFTHSLDPLAVQLGVFRPIEERRRQCKETSNDLRILRTCRQLHDEAHQLALSLTGFDVTGESAKPDCFAARTSTLRESKVAALRHITLTARISYMRAMNEDWRGYPFGHPGLVLETLTIVPTKADCSHTSYREVADLSQVHTLAYILAETVKGLRNVRAIQVENRGCFNEVVFRLVYRSLVYRMFRWAGRECGVRVVCNDEEEDNATGWFRVALKEEVGGEWREVGDEVDRFLGRDGEMPNPELVGF
jgi:hypothetical protein